MGNKTNYPSKAIDNWGARPKYKKSYLNFVNRN